jgi:peptidyl-prolyl cis-trans isomerase D
VLIGWSGAERIRPDVTRNQEEARVRALEVLAKAQAPGADFAALAREFSDGPTAQNGGDLGYFGPGEMTPKFNDFVFGKPVGAIEMIETEFGYHVVKVEEKQPSYQVANLTKYIAPSEQTINELFTKAAAFEMEATKDPLKFEEVAKAQNLSVFPINKLSSMDENLPGIGLQRGIVQWSFLPETKVGEIKKFNVANGYVIVQLVTKLNQGMMDAADAALTVIPVLRNEKKAAALKAQYQGLTLEAAAAKAGVAVQQATAMTTQSPVLPGAGREPFVVGYAFSLEGGATSAPLKGNSGVFLVQVNQKRSPEALADYKVLARSQNAGQINLAPYRAYSARVNAAKIEDNRFLFY